MPLLSPQSVKVGLFRGMGLGKTSSVLIIIITIFIVRTTKTLTMGLTVMVEVIVRSRYFQRRYELVGIVSLIAQYDDATRRIQRNSNRGISNRYRIHKPRYLFTPLNHTGNNTLFARGRVTRPNAPQPPLCSL